MAVERDRRPLSVAWDEAREVLVVVLLVAALLRVVAHMIWYVGFDSPVPWWEDYHRALVAVDVLTGVLLVGTAVAVCTTPAEDMVPRLRLAVYWASVAVALLGVLAIINVLGAPSGGGAMMRLAEVAAGSGPAVVLSGCAAWMARRVVLLG
jgi:hypothetical protein